MAIITWSRQSLEDLEALRAFIARNSPNLAGKFVEKIISSVRSLERFPYSGAIVPEFNREDTREIVRGPYRVIYRASENLILVLAVYHSARLLDESCLQ